VASRRRAREFALQALYRADLGNDPGPQALEALWKGLLDGMVPGRAAEEEEIAYAKRIVDGVAEKKSEIDGLIERSSVNWRLSRMPLVDRNILRLASYELVACDDVPTNVSINEAVELAKRFGDKDSRAFVNGILDRIATEVGRGGRGGHAG
jgi:N utilization substance protein B